MSKKGQRGLSLPEVIISTIILAIIAFFSLRIFQFQSLARVANQGREAIFDVENAVRHAVFRTMKDWFADHSPGCDLTGPPTLPSLRDLLNAVVLPSGLQLQVVRDTTVFPVTGRDISESKFQAALTRCRASPLAGVIPGAYFAIPRSGVYFCVLITAGAGSSVEGGMITKMQPIMMEVAYFNVSTQGAGGMLRCQDVGPNLAKVGVPPVQTAPVIATMYYTLYWTPRTPTATLSRSYTGILTLGGAKDP